MSATLRESIYQAISSIRLIDPHTHINPHAPASTTLADLLGYHYYTELAHSAGMPKSQIEEPGLTPRDLVGRLIRNLSPIENTAQYRWLVEICRMFFGFDGERIDESNWEDVYEAAERQMRLAEWPQIVLDQSNVEAVFLTNDFDDDLAGFDTDTYIPCLRTDDLVFHLGKPEVRQRLARCSGIELSTLTSLRESLNQRFEHFVSRGARACAISLPPSFEPTRVSDGRAETALSEVLRRGIHADASHRTALARRVFWTLAELCDQYGLPFDLMIGVNRAVYTAGVYQGQDLYDSRVSLIQYKELFNAFPDVKFPISVLASVTNQELVSYAWIFPNVITNGHWWYSNTPSFIARDAVARLEAVPQTKQIAYYSDAYKLEFVWPKFDMYRHILAGILTDQFVINQGWSEERAIELGRQILRDNVDEIFPRPSQAGLNAAATKVDPLADTWIDDSVDSSDLAQHAPADPAQTWGNQAAAASSAALAAGSIGIIDVSDAHDQVLAPEVSEEATTDAQESLASEHLDEEDEFPTLVDETSETLIEETFRIEDDDKTKEEQPAQEENVPFDELPTMVEINDTVRIDSSPELEPDADPNVYETLVDSEFISDQNDTDYPTALDPLPNADEIQAVEIADVELDDFGTARTAAENWEDDIHLEPLDVGDLSGEEPNSEPNIQPLRGEQSFTADEDSLRLLPNPLTGELTFRVPAKSEPGEPAFETIDLDEFVAPGETDTVADTWTADELILDVAEDVIDNGQDSATPKDASRGPGASE
jgi:glucuronate isomerase